MGKGLAIGSAALTAPAATERHAHSVNLSAIDLNDPGRGLWGSSAVSFLSVQCPFRPGRAAGKRTLTRSAASSGNSRDHEGTGRPEYEKASISTAAAPQGNDPPRPACCSPPVAVGFALAPRRLEAFLQGDRYRCHACHIHVQLGGAG